MIRNFFDAVIADGNFVGKGFCILKVKKSR
jgi:hypothetical protein